MESAPLRVFLSYASEDALLAADVARLIQTRFGGHVSLFCDRALPGPFDRAVDAGNWLSQIGRELQSSDLVLCLVSPAFLDSRWLYMEGGGGILFGKAVVPVCVPPVTPPLLPLPFNLFQAYDVTPEGQEALVNSLARRWGIEPSAHSEPIPFQSYAVRSPDEPARAAALQMSVGSVSGIGALLRFREVTGDCLARLFARYSGSADMLAQVDCSATGRCRIVRESTVELTSPAFHWYYQIYIDKPGRVDLVEARDLESDRELPILVHRVTDVSTHFSAVFDSVHQAGETLRIRTVVDAENYLSDLFDHGIAQQYYRASSRILVRRNRQVFRFESTIPPHVKCVIADCGDANMIGREISPTTSQGYLEFDVLLEAPQGHSGIDLVEFRMSGSGPK